MQITGHKTRAIFDRYHIVSPADLREGVAKLAKHHEVMQGEPQLQSARVVELDKIRTSEARREKGGDC